jgi:hypothetical protein
MRLDPRFRFALYLAFSLLFVTGVAWLVADQMKSNATSGEEWQTAAAYLLMGHGAAAMVALLLIGALVPLHMQGGWRGRRNRITGALMSSANALLVITSLGLYYAASEIVRPWMSDVHIGVGLCLPVLLFAHVILGRRSRS